MGKKKEFIEIFYKCNITFKNHFIIATLFREYIFLMVFFILNRNVKHISQRKSG